MEENNFNIQPEYIEPQTSNKKSKKPMIFIIILIFIILGLAIYICFDKGVFDKKKTDDSNKTSEQKKNDKETETDDKEKEDETKYSHPINQSKKTELSANSDYKYRFKITYPNYTFIVGEKDSTSDNGYYDNDIYNSKNKLIVTGYGDPDGLNYALNEDGSVTLLTKYNQDTHSYDYERYDYNGNKISNLKNYSRIVALFDNYMIVSKNNHLLLQDYLGNYVEGFDFDLSKGNYEFARVASGWYTDQGKNGIFAVIENLDLEDGQEGCKIEYYYEPSTGNVGTILLSEKGGYAKPVLYLYPTKETKVKVSFEKPELLTVTYPKFNKSWEVTAKSNGDLKDKNGKYYYGLYWEESGSTKVDFKKGFYVTKDNAINFLEEKLSYIGLNDKERNEFIMYWLPILEKNKKSIVYFELTDERQAYNKLNIEPSPDSLLRVAIHVKKVNKKPSKLKEQKLTKFKRTGFTAVEWGGVVHK